MPLNEQLQEVELRRYDPTMRLVLLHALPLDGRMWKAIGPVLGDVYAPRLYGLGGSVHDWAVAVLERCDGDELLVVGSSVGGACALEVACAAPSRVRGVVLVGAKASVRPDPRARDEAVRFLRDNGVAAAWDRYWAPLFGARAEPDVVAAARLLALEQDVEDLVAGVRAFHDRRDLSEFVRTWRGQLLLVSGAEDRTPTPALALRSVAGANATQVIIKGAGHYVPLEQPHALLAIVEEQRRVLQA